MIKSIQCDGNIVYPTFASLLTMRAEQQPCRVGYTFISSDGTREDVTYSELDQRARAIACILDSLRKNGNRAMLLYPSGIDYIASFFGCMYAGAIAVPACPPDPLRLTRSLSRLVGIVRDAAPSVVLTTAAMGRALGSLFRSTPELSRLRIVTPRDVPGEPLPAREPAPVDADSVALLQYTSGSTSAPRGVVLTHRNLMSNSALIYRLCGHSRESRGMLWLPPYHDMGLIGGILQPLYGGFPTTLMSPEDFLRQPLRWLQEISNIRATISGGPNFAYELCARKTTAEERLQLDLSSWQVAFNGSEPVRAGTMENFSRAFELSGFRREAFHPCYGLAEATLMVSGGVPWSQRDIESFDAVSLRYGTAVPSAADAKSRRLVSCGAGWHDSRVVIVDPNTHMERAEGRIGEIWISGASVAHSYWRRPLETKETFGARLAGTGEGPFLRSGDLGFVLGRKLFITGRIKDLIIIRGRNHYPQDIELTAERSSPVLRPGCAAAFTVPDGDRERLVIAHEIKRQADEVNVGEVADAIRAAVAAEHGIGVHTVVLVPPGGIQKTSSGKVQRGLCAAMFACGQLAEIGRSVTNHMAEVGPLHLDRSSLLFVPWTERQSLLQDYLAELVASACAIDAAKVAVDVPLLALGLESYAAISIQHAIRADLGTHVTASDLGHTATIADVAALIDKQLRTGTTVAKAQPFLTATPPRPRDGSSDMVRRYRWVSGSRVPDPAALSPNV